MWYLSICIIDVIDDVGYYDDNDNNDNKNF